LAARPPGCGTVFALSPPAAGETRWTETVLHRFRGVRHGGDGAAPFAGLIADANGVLYGTTVAGGDTSCSLPGPAPGCGTVFALSPPAAGETWWTERVLYSFRGGLRDGAFPEAGLIADAKGVLYGTTFQGGENTGFSCVMGAGALGCGTVFALSPPAAGKTLWTERVLYRFQAGDGDGNFPQAGLIADAKGVLYGTTAGGGMMFCGDPNDPVHCGTIFALSPPTAAETRWTETVLYRFDIDHGGPPGPSGLIADAKGVLYGTTGGGGYNDIGTVFALSPPTAGETR
jgi:uncharacterized repeat protein (TIGR03803 family)